ncbi:hypothetical protein BKA70DRAFT_682940 [Coprinopsis sp. MPI-PUGE-AT-0042]|nr:hypothetical protein BKA70DRAFT_682940 [Coprinopsis sp. MPI-PUGE-AT-0042]
MSTVIEEDGVQDKETILGSERLAASANERDLWWEPLDRGGGNDDEANEAGMSLTVFISLFHVLTASMYLSEILEVVRHLRFKVTGMVTYYYPRTPFARRPTTQCQVTTSSRSSMRRTLHSELHSILQRRSTKPSVIRTGDERPGLTLPHPSSLDLRIPYDRPSTTFQVYSPPTRYQLETMPQSRLSFHHGRGSFVRLPRRRRRSLKRA